MTQSQDTASETSTHPTSGEEQHRQQTHDNNFILDERADGIRIEWWGYIAMLFMILGFLWAGSVAFYETVILNILI